MSVSCLSFDLASAPGPDRLALVYGPEDLSRSATKLAAKTRSSFVVLLTCNRAEVYFPEGANMTGTLFSSSLGLGYLRVKEYESSFSGDDCVRHLLELSTGILSPCFGEEAIISQISLALETAKRVGSADSSLDHLFRHVLNFAKGVHTRHQVRVFDTALVEKVAEACSGKRALVIGSGALARMVSAALLKVCPVVTQTVRSSDKADFLVPAGVTAAPYDDRLPLLEGAGCVVSASSGVGYTLDEDALPLLKGKLLIDLASPSDFPPSFRALREEDFGAPTPLRDAVVEKVRAEAEESLLAYKAEEGKREAFKDTDRIAYDAASALVRKMRGPLSLDDEGASALFECARKTYISAALRRR